MAEVLKYLKRSEPSAVPPELRMPCQFQMKLLTPPEEVHFLFEVKITHPGYTFEIAQNLRHLVFPGFETALKESLDPTYWPDVEGITRGMSGYYNGGIRPYGEDDDYDVIDTDTVQLYSWTYYCSRFAQYATDRIEMNKVFDALQDSWSTPSEALPFMIKLVNTALSAVNMTALPETSTLLASSGGAGSKRTYLRVSVDAVRDADVPDGIPSQGVDKRSEQLLNELRKEAQ